MLPSSAFPTLRFEDDQVRPPTVKVFVAVWFHCPMLSLAYIIHPVWLPGSWVTVRLKLAVAPVPVILRGDSLEKIPLLFVPNTEKFRETSSVHDVLSITTSYR